MSELHPIPKSMAERLREIPVGASQWFAWSEVPPSTIRTTITRIKTGTQPDYITRPEDNGLRVWRLA